MTRSDGTAAIIFARAPRPGAVKTRLIPVLGAEGAAEFHALLVKQTLETARAASFRQSTAIFRPISSRRDVSHSAIFS